MTPGVPPSCPECGDDLHSGSPVDSDVLVVWCASCGYEDAR